MNGIRHILVPNDRGKLQAAYDARYDGEQRRFGNLTAARRWIRRQRKEKAVKKSEVKVGHVYQAKVTNKVVPVRIDSENRHGGWDATNLETNKKVRIKSAQRLRAEVKPKRSAAKVTEAAEPDANPTVEVVTGQPLPEGDGGKAAKPRRAKKAAGEPKPKRVSALDAAAQLLADADQPMRAKEMIETMAERGLWSSPNGKTPEATLYAAILREIKAKGDAARFRKIERGQFIHTGVQEG